MLFQINQPEHELLLDILGVALGNLREEIYKTEAAEYQRMLKQRESLLTGLLARLTAADASGLAVGEPVSEH
jgi:hypothetical protein